MQVIETNADGLKREFKIVVAAGDLEDQINRRLGEIGRSIRIPGFRPGKVPMQLLRRRYGPAVRGEVLESTVQGSSAEAMREQNLRPALPPRVEIVSADEGADLEYTMSVELLPDVPEPNFSDLGLERLIAEVPDEDIDKAVERMAEQQRKSEPVERAAQAGDIVVADFVGRIGGEEFPGGKGDGVPIEIGAGRFIPGFEDQLTGASAGEERTVNVTFPAEYNPELAGKDAAFAVTVKEVRERQPGLAGDDLAKEIGLETIAELRQEIRERMQREYDMLARQRLKRALLDKLAGRFDFPVPPGMVEMEFESIWQQYEAEKQRHEAAESQVEGGDAAAEATPAAEATVPESSGAAAGDGEEAAAPADPEEEKARVEYRGLAERRVRLGLLLAEIGRNNNITVSQDELNQALTREAQRHPGYERQVLDYYRRTPEAVNNLRAPIFEEKVVDFIVELAKPEERKVPPAELMSFAAAEDAAAEDETATPQ